MSDLIDRQALLEVLREEFTDPQEYEEIWFNLGAGTVMSIIKHQPSAEKRGRWIDDELSAKRGWYFANCSECGYQMDVHENRGYYRYCPNCGAKMEGGSI